MLYINDKTVLEPEDIVEMRLHNETCYLKLEMEHQYFTELDILHILVGIGVAETLGPPKETNLSFGLAATEQSFKALVPIEVRDHRMFYVCSYDTTNIITINYDIEFKNPK